MEAFQLLSKRRHINKFSEKAPDEELIKKLIWQTWKVTPSKNNFMPYKVHVLGPECVKEKQKVLAMAQLNKKRTNERSNVMEIKNYEEDGFNQNFEFLSTVPYLLVCTQRVCEPNEYIRIGIAEGNNIYEQMHESMLDDVIKTASTEVGMFKANLTALCLEQGIDTSCIACFPHHPEPWQEVGLDWVEYPVILLIGIGYCEESRQDRMRQDEKDGDKKPELETVVNYI